MSSDRASSASVDAAQLRRFLHDVSAPLSAVSLHLEAASRQAARGDDPSRSLETARRELARAFELFERGRQDLLASRESAAGGSSR